MWRIFEFRIELNEHNRISTFNHLSILIDNNLIEYSNGTQTFKTTEKGLNCLKMYREIGEFLQQKTTAIKND
jgi:predicted transcriptional regulator